MKLDTYNTSKVFTPSALADGLEIDVANVKNEYMLLVFNITATDAGATMTLRPSDTYSQASLGSLELSKAVSEYAIAVETARFKAADGKLYIDIDTIGLLAGTVALIELP